MSLPSFMPSQYGFDSGVIGCGIGRSGSMRLLSCITCDVVSTPFSRSPPLFLQQPAEPLGDTAPHNPGFVDIGEERVWSGARGLPRLAAMAAPEARRPRC